MSQSVVLLLAKILCTIYRLDRRVPSHFSSPDALITQNMICSIHTIMQSAPKYFSMLPNKTAITSRWRDPGLVHIIRGHWAKSCLRREWPEAFLLDIKGSHEEGNIISLNMDFILAHVLGNHSLDGQTWRSQFDRKILSRSKEIEQTLDTPTVQF